MIKKLLHIFLVIAMTFVFVNCEKQNQRDVSYRATQCTDPWGSGTINEITPRIESYFLDKGVSIIAIDFKQDDDLLVCEACGCYTGTVIIATVDKEDVSIMIEHGFSRAATD